MSRILIEYDPALSDEAKNIIRDKVSPSMISTDGSTHQYNIDFIMADVFRELSVEDKIVLQALTADNVEYIEFETVFPEEKSTLCYKCGHEYDNSMDNFCSNCLTSK
jgi:hypothetical protein